MAVDYVQSDHYVPLVAEIVAGTLGYDALMTRGFDIVGMDGNDVLTGGVVGNDATWRIVA